MLANVVKVTVPLRNAGKVDLMKIRGDRMTEGLRLCFRTVLPTIKVRLQFFVEIRVMAFADDSLVRSPMSG